MKKIRKILVIFLIILVMIQFIRISKVNPEIITENDFLVSVNASPEISSLIKTSCYDCHSNETTYPWYTNIAPVSWWIKHHINEGREELNFSEWSTFKEKRKNHKLEECVEMIEENEMPMSSYTLLHKNAALSEEQKQKLILFFQSLRTDNKE